MDNRYVVRSGDGYVCQDNGDELPLMIAKRTAVPIAPREAFIHTLEEATERLVLMDRHGLHAAIELASKEAE